MKFSVDPKIIVEKAVSSPVKPISIKPMRPFPLTPSLFTRISWEDENSLSFQLKKIIFQTIEEAVGKNEVKFEDIKIEHPAEESFGDYSTNIALILAGRLKVKPLDLVQRIADCLNKKIISYSFIGKAEVAGGGFLNLWLRKDYLITQMFEVLIDENGVRLTRMKGKKVAVEYTDPNPFKEFHLGHLYSNFIGESIACLYEACGAKVWRGDFYGDVGMHVAKSVWGVVRKLKDQKLNIKDLEKLPLDERIKFLGQGYALGVVKYEEGELIQEEIKDMNYLIYVAAQEVLKKTKGWQPIINYWQYVKGKENRLSEVRPVYEAGLRWSLEYFETIYKKLGTKFDGYYPESWVGEYGMKLVEKGLKIGVLEKTDGAVVYRGEQDGLHTRVFVNKLGLPTYEAKDLGLAFAKYQDFQYDFSINVFGKEIDEYYKVVKAALGKIEPELGKKAFHIPHGMVKLPQGKMSSRSGNVVTFAGLMEEAKRQALKIMKDIDINEVEKQTVSEIVALGAIRYALLKSSLGNDVIFDFGKSVSFEGDSGPYLMYTYARCKSVIRKAEEVSSIKGKILNTKYYIPNTEEIALLRTLYRFPEVILEATRTLSPNLICSFLFDLAQKYNLFYNKHSILSPSIPQNLEPRIQQLKSIVNFRLSLTAATAAIIKRGLGLLGIKTVERM